MKNIEKNFVEGFIIKECKKRFLYELETGQREKAIMKFCHNAENYIKPSVIVDKKSFILQKEIVEFFQTDKEVYTLTIRLIDGEFVSVEEVYKIFQNESMPVIAYSKNFAIIKTEKECHSLYYFLKSSNLYVDK